MIKYCRKSILIVLFTIYCCSIIIKAFPECCKRNVNAEICQGFEKLSLEEQASLSAEGVLDDQCQLITHTTPEKRKPNFIRYGRSLNVIPQPMDKKAVDPNFLRFGRSEHQNFLRFGRSLGGNNGNFLRFGKSNSPDFLRFGKKSIEVGKEPNFLRFGKRENFIGFGKSMVEEQFNREYRKPNFLRFGKRSTTNTNFLRFGRSPAAVFFEDVFDRNYRQQPDFLRFGNPPTEYMISYTVADRLGEDLDEYFCVKTETYNTNNSDKQQELLLPSVDRANVLPITAFTPTASLPPSRNINRESFTGIKAPILRIRNKTDKTKRELESSTIKVYKPQKRTNYSVQPRKVVCLGTQKRTMIPNKIIPGSTKTVKLSQKQNIYDKKYVFPSQPSPPHSDTSSHGCIDYTRNYCPSGQQYNNDGRIYIEPRSNSNSSCSNRQTPEVEIDELMPNECNVIDYLDNDIYLDQNYMITEDYPKYEAQNNDVECKYQITDGCFDPSNMYVTETNGIYNNQETNSNNIYEYVNQDLSLEKLTIQQTPTTISNNILYKNSTTPVPDSSDSIKGCSLLRGMLENNTSNYNQPKKTINVRVIKSDIKIPQTETALINHNRDFKSKSIDTISSSGPSPRCSAEPSSRYSLANDNDNDFASFFIVEDSGNKTVPNESKEQIEKRFNEDEEFKSKLSNNSLFEKPQLPYAAFVTLILNNLNTFAISVSEVYDGIIFLFPHFETAYEGWRNSIRHNLSMSRLYEKVEAKVQIGSRKACMWSMVKREEAFNFNEVHKIDANMIDHIKSTMRFPQLWDPLVKGNLKLFPLSHSNLKAIVPEFISENEIEEYISYIRKYAFYMRRLGNKHFMKSPRKTAKGRRKRVKKEDGLEEDCEYGSNINKGNESCTFDHISEPSIKRNKIDELTFEDYPNNNVAKTDNKMENKQQSKVEESISEFDNFGKALTNDPFCLTPDEEESIINNYFVSCNGFNDMADTLEDFSFSELHDDIMLENDLGFDDNKENYQSSYNNQTLFDNYEDLNTMYNDRNKKNDLEEFNGMNNTESSLKDTDQWCLDLI
uniref:Fork-head domain-containing protein n=1 Tax=Strongyloides stercoralis TaxID=6248 RepID=A0A0K0EB26_STRER